MGLIHNAARTRVADVNPLTDELNAVLNQGLVGAGYAAIAGETDTSKQRNTFISPEKRLSVGNDNVLFDDSFTNGANSAVNTRKYSIVASGFTAAQTSSPGLVLNAAGSSAAGAAFIRSYKTIPILGTFPTVLDVHFSPVIAPSAGTFHYIGLGQISVVAGPTEGIFLQLASNGGASLVVFRPVTGAATGAVSATSPFNFVPSAGRYYHLRLVITSDVIELYIDDVLQTSMATKSTDFKRVVHAQNAAYSLIAGLNQPITTSVLAPKLMVQRWSVSSGDAQLMRPWGAMRTGLGDNVFSTPDGVASATLDNIANSAAPAAATLSNTAAGYTTLGGNFLFTLVAGAETDYALFAYQVPLGSITQVPKILRITEIGIDAQVSTSNATVALLNWYVGIGATAVSLATADATTTRAPHRKFLGAQNFPAAGVAGTRDGFIKANFSANPLQVEAGTFLHIILKLPVSPVGGAIRGNVAIKGYFE